MIIFSAGKVKQIKPKEKDDKVAVEPDVAIKKLYKRKVKSDQKAIAF